MYNNMFIKTDSYTNISLKNNILHKLITNEYTLVFKTYNLNLYTKTKIRINNQYYNYYIETSTSVVFRIIKHIRLWSLKH